MWTAKSRRKRAETDLKTAIDRLVRSAENDASPNTLSHQRELVDQLIKTLTTTAYEEGKGS